MKAWVYRKDSVDDKGLHLFLEDIPKPQPAAGQVLIKVKKVSVCGTDESLFKGDLKRVPDGIVPGHEFYGEIVELGSRVTGLKPGQTIAGESHYQVSGTDDQGIIGLWGPEIRKGESLPALNGAYAEYLTIPAECAYPVPDEYVGDQFWPSLFEAIGNDYFLIKHSTKENNIQKLGVFGCGPHGLFAQIFAKHFGIKKIAAFEIDEFRRDFAKQMEAADAVYNPLTNLQETVSNFTGGSFFDATLDMVGKQGQGFQSCCDTTRDGGTVYLFGLFTDKFAIAGIQGNEIIFKMKTLDYEYRNKRLRVEGITGREGIWHELIDTVCRNEDLQNHLMRPVKVMGTLDQLGDDNRNPKPGIMKRAYYPFS
jgi:threonine 3-dehydrogenase